MKTLKKVSILSKDQSSISLCDANNYLPFIVFEKNEIIQKINDIVNEYILDFLKIKKIKINHFKIIFDRGLTSVIHIFMYIIINTNNLVLSCYHSKQGYKYYIEFVEQLMDENIDCLQLTTNDAILFTYKKTIFELNKSFTKVNTELEQSRKIFYSELNNTIEIYKSLLLYSINQINTVNDLNDNNNINNCSSKIITIIYSITTIPNYINTIQLIISVLQNSNPGCDKVFEKIIIYINYLKKYKPNNIILYNNLCACKTIEDIETELL
jgi:hypothetical protein